jgi:hypothetical protein
VGSVHPHTGGHGNLWILELSSGRSNQITFDKDPNLVTGVPLWSPEGSQIAYARVLAGHGTSSTGYWFVRPDGRENHLFVPNASWFTRTADGHCAYYIDSSRLSDATTNRILKDSLPGSSPRWK